MAGLKERPLSPEQLQRASTNYLRCLNLPPASKVLIITDKPTGKTNLLKQDDMSVRAEVVSSLQRQMEREGYWVHTEGYEKDWDFEKYRQETNRALKELEQLPNAGFVDNTTTVVYLGQKWEERFGIYQAAEDFGTEKNRLIRFSGSLGFSTGDARVMSELTEDKMKLIEQENTKFTEFFEKKPEGKFEIKTLGPDGEERTLNLSYNTKEAPFEPDTGQFDDKSNNFLSKHVKYINIPGGEIFAAPFPFKETNGEFAAQGMLFKVENGFVVKITELVKGAMEGKDEMQTLLVDLIQNQGKKIPVAELGLGLYELAGIKTYSDSSILSLEKGGPHIGFAHTYTTSEKAAIEGSLTEQGIKFGHTDFVLDNPVMTWMDTKEQAREQFYPPTTQALEPSFGQTDVR